MNTKLFLIASSLLMVINGVNIGQAMESSEFSPENNINAEDNQDELNSNKQIQYQKDEEEEDKKINKSDIIRQDKINQNNKKDVTFTEPFIGNTYEYKKDNNIKLGMSTIDGEYENEENINNIQHTSNNLSQSAFFPTKTFDQRIQKRSNIMINSSISNYNKNNNVMNEDENVINEDENVINEDENVINEDENVINEDENVINEDENEINDNMENNSNIFNINNYNNYSNKNESEFQNNNINDNIMNNENNDNELSNININNNDNLFLKPQKEKEQELDNSYCKLKEVTNQISDALDALKISKKDQNEFLDYVYQNQKLVNNYEKNKIRIQNELRVLKLNDLLNNSIIVEGMKQLAQLYCEHITSAYYDKLPDKE